MKDKCSECNRNATRMEYTDKGPVYYCGRHCPSFIALKRAAFDQLLALADAVQAYLTAPADIHHTTDGDSAVPAEEAFYKLVNAFKVYRPDVKLPEKLT